MSDQGIVIWRGSRPKIGRGKFDSHWEFPIEEEGDAACEDDDDNCC